MLKAGGYAFVKEADGTIAIECDTFTCAHGNEIVKVRPGAVNHAPVCMKCMGKICLKCQRIANETGECVPTEKMLQRMERGPIRRAG